jgi:hypothetical protein
MRHNEPAYDFAIAQPVVGSVPQPDDESDVTCIGIVPFTVCPNSQCFSFQSS